MANVKLPTDNEITDFLSKVEAIDDVLKGLNSQDGEDVQEYMSKADGLIKEAEHQNEVKDKKQEADDDDDDQGLPKTKTGFSKTSINKDAYKSEPNPGLTGPSVGPSVPEDGPMDQKAFMAVMEADAVERAERRAKKERMANGFKNQGNTEFRQGNYTKALEFYDKAMDQLKDSLAIYTNRAQTRIKLGMFDQALTDCHWALRLHPNSLKALVHQGHAHLGLKEFDKARDSYRQILDVDGSKDAMVNDYIAAANREEQALHEEQKASQSFAEGSEMATGLVNLLTRIKKEGQLPIYYSGGFRAVTQTLKDVESQTLFRTNGGLHLPVTHPELARCLSVPALGDLNTGDRDLVGAVMAMMEMACKDNETSQQHILSNNGHFPQQLLSLLAANYKGQGRILKTSCLNLMHTISLTPAGRAAIVTKFDLIPLISCLFMLMTKSSPYAETAAALLNNMALEKRLKSVTRDSIEDQILPAFESLMKSNKTPPTIVALASSTFTNLAADNLIRVKISGRPSFWTVMSDLVASLTESKLCSTLEFVLGLLVNVSTSLSTTSSSSSSSSTSSSTSSSSTSSSSTSSLSSKVFQDSSNTIHETCFNMVALSRQPATDEDGGGGDNNSDNPLPSSSSISSPSSSSSSSSSCSSILVTRCLVVLSNVLPHSDEACGWLGVADRVRVLMEFTKDDRDITNRKSALKCLTVLAQNNASARDAIADNKGTSLLLQLLQKEEVKNPSGGGEGKGAGDVISWEDHEVIMGNATLCLSHLATRSDVCQKLTKTNIIQRLLVLARDGRNASLQSNAAILVGKLVKGDGRHLERLRELHGIEILHGCMKHIK